MDMELTDNAGSTVLTSDSLKVGKYSLGGAVKLNEINFIGELDALKNNNKIGLSLKSSGK